jgi:hypothetical protein
MDVSKSVISPLGFSPATQTAPRLGRLRQEALYPHTRPRRKSQSMINVQHTRLGVRTLEKRLCDLRKSTIVEWIGGHEGHDSRPSELKKWIRGWFPEPRPL